MTRWFLAAGALFGFCGVLLGAFAAHVLKDVLPPDLFAVFEVGVRYHMYHALALLAVGWGTSQFPQARLQVSGYCFIAGIVLFSGSLYAMSTTGLRWLGAITPLGGMLFLAGWAWFGWSLWKSR